MEVFGAAFAALVEWSRLTLPSAAHLSTSSSSERQAERALRNCCPRCVLVNAAAAGCGSSSLLNALARHIADAHPSVHVFHIDLSCTKSVDAVLAELSRVLFDEALAPDATAVVLLDHVDDLALLDAGEGEGSVASKLATLIEQCGAPDAPVHDTSASVLLSDVPLHRGAERSVHWRFVLSSHSGGVADCVQRVVGHVIHLPLPDLTARRALCSHVLLSHHAVFGASDTVNLLQLAADVASMTSGFTLSQVMRCFRLAALQLRQATLLGADGLSPIPPPRVALSAAVAVVLDSISSAWGSFAVSFRAAPATASPAAVPAPVHGRVSESYRELHPAEVVWRSVGGYSQVKLRMLQMIAWPLLHPTRLVDFGVSSPKGLLLHGPSGCGKSLLVQELASICNVPLLVVKGPELMSKFVGVSEGGVRRMFRRARAQAPCILFLDQLDAIAAKRSMGGPAGDGAAGVYERVLSTLLNEMDGIESACGVVVLGATTRPESIDAALCRPGRFDELVHVPVPCAGDRLAIFKVATAVSPLSHDVDLDRLAADAWSSGWTGADVTACVSEAALAALRRSIEAECIIMADFECVRSARRE